MIFILILLNDIFSALSKIVVMWMPQNSIDDKSTLVQVMAWCLMAPSHYLNQCWPSSLLSYGITKGQWVNPLILFVFDLSLSHWVLTVSGTKWTLNFSIIVKYLASEKKKKILKFLIHVHLHWWTNDHSMELGSKEEHKNFYGKMTIDFPLFKNRWGSYFYTAFLVGEQIFVSFVCKFL